jgi:hypothetical protein
LNILYGKLSDDRITRWTLLLEEYGPTYVHIAGKNNIVADALSRLEKVEDEKLSETEEGLVLSHAMCAVEQDEAILVPETKHDLVHHIMNADEMESEEFPMSPDIIAREQKKVLNYSHSRNPLCAPAWTHGRIQAPREPPN